jgi:glycosyltransferase involved in cell wall biosynthesis
MNILIIPTNDWTKSPGTGHINYIAEELARRGHKIYVWNFNLYRNQPQKRKAVWVKLVESKAIPLRDPASFFGLNALAQAPAILKATRKLGIHVVINENVLSGLVAFLVAGNGALKVFDFSDYFPESASVYYNGSSPVAKKAVEAVTLAITKLNVKFSDVCISVCQSLIHTAKQMDKSKTCYLITNGVNTKPINPKAQASPNPYMVVMGVIDDWLDFEAPLQALKLLTAKHPEFKLVIIGPWQKPKFQNDVAEQTRKLGVESNVTVTGYISKKELDNYLQHASCCLMPYRLDSYYSIIRLPEKFFVYSAYGKPIFSTRLPEVAALKTGHVFFYQNDQELAEAIEQTLNDKTLMQELSEKGRLFAEEHDFKTLALDLEGILTRHLLGIKSEVDFYEFDVGMSRLQRVIAEAAALASCS